MRLWLLCTISLISLVVSAAGRSLLRSVSVNPALLSFDSPAYPCPTCTFHLAPAQSFVALSPAAFYHFKSFMKNKQTCFGASI